MHQIMDARELTVTLETPDGYVWTGKAMMSTIEYGQAFDKFGTVNGPLDWRMDLVGVGSLELTQRDQFIKQVRGASTWRCVYCGALMQAADLKCAGCGGWRPVIYDV